MSLPLPPPMRSNKPRRGGEFVVAWTSDSQLRSGQARVVTLVLLSVLGFIGIYLTRRHVEPLSTHASAPAETTQTTVGPSVSEASKAKSIQDQALIASLPKSARRASWFDPADPELWQLAGWFLNEGRLQSSELAISRATFRQPYQNVSLSFRLNWQPPPDDSINSGELLYLYWVDENEIPVMKLGLSESRLELETISDSSRQVIRSASLHLLTRSISEGFNSRPVDSFDCTLRIVQTQDRLLTAVNDQLAWNIARPDLLTGPRFMSFQTTNRALTVSELRFETSDSL